MSEGGEQKVWRSPVNHCYGVWIIQLSIQQVLYGLSSWGGAERSFELWSQFFTLPTPSSSSIRRWFLRLGLYELQRDKAYRHDWIFIVDLTIELGVAKCLVILGIHQVDWQKVVKESRGLRHQDVEVLALEVLVHSSGQVLEQKLESLAKQVGQPVQILADHGSDLKKGIDLYCQAHPEVLYTYDVTHQMALLLKHELSSDERYQAFLGHCSRSRQQLQQTELAFLIPPSQRPKARYFNVESLVDWAQKLLNYQHQNDFSAINPGFRLDQASLETLKDKLDSATHAKLSQLKGIRYDDKSSFTQALRHHLEISGFGPQTQLICQTADLGRRRFLDKLGWLADYQDVLHTYTQMLELVHGVEKQLKRQGLRSTSKDSFVEATQSMRLSPRLEQFKARIIEYLDQESRNLPEGQVRLATSDIIESIFGKYKWFSAKGAFKEIGSMILTIPLCTLEITSDVVKRAMETVRTLDVAAWANRVFGQSMLSKRKELLKKFRQDTKVA